MSSAETFETLEFKVGKHKTDTSYARILVKERNPKHLENILKEIYPLGAVPFHTAEAKVAPAPKDMVFPDNFVDVLLSGNALAV